MRQMRNACKIVLNLNEGDHLGDMAVSGRTLLKCILEKQCEDVDWIYLAQVGGQLARSCEHCNETSGFIKGMEFVD